jgi:hypothetical protein
MIGLFPPRFSHCGNRAFGQNWIGASRATCSSGIDRGAPAPIFCSPRNCDSTRLIIRSYEYESS